MTPPWNQLDAGIVKAVRLLWEAGYTTTDSGDGSKFEYMDGALEYPHVVVRTTPENLIADTHRILNLNWSEAGYDLPKVEGSYCANDEIAIVFVSWLPEPSEDICSPHPPV